MPLSTHLQGLNAHKRPDKIDSDFIPRLTIAESLSGFVIVKMPAVLIMKSMSGAPWWFGFGTRSVERPSRIGISFSLSIVSTSCVIELNLWTPSFTFYTFPLSRTWINSFNSSFSLQIWVELGLLPTP